MKKATAKKLDEIKNRVRSLKASFSVKLRADAEDKFVPRVCALVFREGSWLVTLVERLHAKPGTKFEKKKDVDGNVTQDDEADLASAKAFFAEKVDTYSDEVDRNLFIDRVEVEFITHMERMVLLALRLDAQVKSQVASIDDEADEGDEVESAIAEEVEA